MEDLDTRIEVIQDLLKRAQAAKEKINLTIMEKLVELKSKHFDALVELEKELKTAPDPDQQRLNQLHNAIAAVKKFRDDSQNELIRWKKLPKLGADDWLVYGLITHADGSFAEGLIVNVFDEEKGKKTHDKLGTAKTDELGNFYLVYRNRNFGTNDKQPDLYVIILEKGGKQLYSTKDAVRNRASRKEYFQIILPS